MRRSTSLLALLTLLPAVGQADAFGRYGYSDKPTVPGLVVDHDGFVAKHPAADRIRFATQLPAWKIVTTSEFGQTVGFGLGAGNPNKGRFTTTAPGFALYFPKGLKLKVGSTAAPYLTWNQGSASTDVPTPDVRWLVLSFRDAQPPLILGFPGKATSLKVSGRPADWTIEAPEDFSGWVRVGLPVGVRAAAANTAAELGRLAKTAGAQWRIWSRLSPELKSVQVTQDPQAVTATWTFDSPGAMVPVGATMAASGGYPVTIDSRYKRVDAPTEDGPMDILEGSQLRVRLPIRRIPTGRAVALGAALGSALGTASPQDVNSVVELALENLVASRDVLTRKAAEDTLAEFVSQATYTAEPFTQQQLPYNAAGVGADLAAANALLMQSVTSTQRATSEANSLLTSLGWRRDWATWRFWGAEGAVSRRAGALAALAAGLCPEPERRLEGAMFQAGLSAERGLMLWRRRNGLEPKDTPLLETMLGVRQGMFGLRGKAEDGEAFWRSLVSPLRAYGDTPVSFGRTGENYTLEWPIVEAKPSVLTLASSYPLNLLPAENLPSLRITQALGFTELRYVPEAAGTCRVSLTLPKWAKAPPPAVPVPRYSERAQ